MKKSKIIMGMAASDAHVVANKLLSFYLQENNFEVINLGACTSLSEFVEAYTQHLDTVAIVIGSLNGHAAEDLKNLKHAKQIHGISCPIIVGGNLSVGSQKFGKVEAKLYEYGVDRIVKMPEDLIKILQRLCIYQNQKNEYQSQTIGKVQVYAQ